MHQDDRTPHQRIPRHISRFGWPLPKMAGGDPNDPDPQTPEGTPQSPDTPEFPALPFSIDDVPETLSRSEAQAWLRGREAQMQRGYTKVVQESREAQKAAEEALSLRQRLEDDATRREAIAEILSRDGIEIEWPDELQGLDPGDDDLDADYSQPDPQLIRRIEAIEQRNQQSDEQSQRDAWINHTRAGLQAFAEREKVGSLEQVPEPIRKQIVANAMSEPRLDNGLLDMEAGIRLYDLQRAEIARITREGYIASKDTPAVDIGGGSADPHNDLTTVQGRVAAGLKIAQRHH